MSYCTNHIERKNLSIRTQHQAPEPPDDLFQPERNAAGKLREDLFLERADRRRIKFANLWRLSDLSKHAADKKDK
jgi:hypothetical protein